MTAHGYEPTGKTFEQRMQDILRRRERWLSETPTAAGCTILISAADRDTIGWWMEQHGLDCRVPARGKVGQGTVWFVDSAEVPEQGRVE